MPLEKSFDTAQSAYLEKKQSKIKFVTTYFIATEELPISKFKENTRTENKTWHLTW